MYVNFHQGNINYKQIFARLLGYCKNYQFIYKTLAKPSRYCMRKYFKLYQSLNNILFFNIIFNRKLSEKDNKKERMH